MTARGVASEKIRTIHVPPGTVQGRLTVLEEGRVPGPGNTTLRGLVCDCACGNRLTVRLDSFVDGKSRSCGCLHKELVAAQMAFQNQVMSGIPIPERKDWWAANRCSIAREPERAARMLAEAAERERLSPVSNPAVQERHLLARRQQRAEARRANGSSKERVRDRWERTELEMPAPDKTAGPAEQAARENA